MASGDGDISTMQFQTATASASPNNGVLLWQRDSEQKRALTFSPAEIPREEDHDVNQGKGMRKGKRRMNVDPIGGECLGKSKERERQSTVHS